MKILQNKVNYFLQVTSHITLYMPLNVCNYVPAFSYLYENKYKCTALFCGNQSNHRNPEKKHKTTVAVIMQKRRPVKYVSPTYTQL